MTDRHSAHSAHSAQSAQSAQSAPAAAPAAQTPHPFAVIDGGRAGAPARADRRRRAAWLAAELDAAGDFFADPLGTRPLSPALADALDAVAGLPPCDLVLVPRQADAEMVEAGAAAGGVDPLTAARVWRGMVGEAE